MNITDTQGLYMVLILPSLFGLTLLTEGVWKVLHQRLIGLLNIIIGFMFMAAVAVGYLLFKG